MNTLNSPRLNLDVSDLALNDESVSLMIHSLALECHEFALASGILSHSVEDHLPLVFSVLDGNSGDLLDFVSVITPDAPCIASLTVRFSDEGYAMAARAAKDRMANAVDGDTDV